MNLTYKDFLQMEPHSYISLKKARDHIGKYYLTGRSHIECLHVYNFQREEIRDLGGCLR